MRSEKYRRWIASLPCLLCASRETQAAHTVKGGLALKGSDASCVPLCCTGHDHHGQLDGRVRLPSGEMGNKRMPDGRYRFEHFYRLSLASYVRALNERWEEKTGDKERFDQRLGYSPIDRAGCDSECGEGLS